MDRKRVQSFDVIKAVIIMLAVVIGHYWQFTPGEYWSWGNSESMVNLTNQVTQISFRTYSLMECLFMISGFQMWIYYERIQNKEIGFGAYVFRRMRRLLPMSVITTIVMAVALLKYKNMTGQWWMGLEVSVKNMLMSFLGIQSWFQSVHVMNGPLWYVSVYLGCTILFYVLVWAEYKTLGRFHVKYVFMVIPILVGIYGVNHYLDMPLLNPDMFRGYMGFFAGVITGAIANTGVPHKLLCGGCGISVIFYLWLSGMNESIGIYGSSSLSLMVTEVFFYAPILILLAVNKKADRIIGNKVLCFLGKISFSMYVWNFPFCLWITIVENAFHLGIPFPYWYMLWIQSGLQMVIGAMSYYFLEKPLDRLWAAIHIKKLDCASV